MNGQIWSFVITAISLTAIWFVGDHKKVGFLIGLFGQFVWFAYAFAFEQYGFILHAIAFSFIYSRNWYKWRNLEVIEIEN